MKYTWLVEKYLEGELSGEELRRFELDILRKPEVAEEVERIRTLNRFMEEQHRKMNDRTGLLEDFSDLENVVDTDEIGRDLESLKVRKISSSKDPEARLRNRILESRTRDSLNRSGSSRMIVRKTSLWIAAASVVLVAITSTLALTVSKKSSYAALYERFYLHRPADIERDAADSGDPFEKAMQAYNKADYEDALRLLNSIPEEGADNNYFFYKGLTAMELGRFELAVDNFNKLDGDEVLGQEGLWYKSLCYLRLDEPEAVRELLNKIILQEGYYREMAQALRKQI
jgi:tetratricopeptide (TPR) repeat protein